MARDRQPIERKKRFTDRETILLISLILVAMIYAYANFFFLPTLDEINLLKTNNDTLQLEYDTRISLIAQKEELSDRLKDNNRLYTGYKNQYYKTTNQEHIIKVLELDLFGKNDLDIASLSFSEVLPMIEFNSGVESIISLHSRIVTFPFEGSYESLIELIRRLENNKQLIRINSLDILQFEPLIAGVNGVVGNQQRILYQGNITIEFFIIPQEYVYPWNVGLPEYDKAGTYDGSLFFYDDGGLVPPIKVVVDEVEVENGNVDEIDEDDNLAEVDDEKEVDTSNVDGSEDEEEKEEKEDIKDEENQAEVDDVDVTLPKTYLVLPGDTLWGISVRFYGTNDYVDQIMFINNISDTHLFRSGSTIRLPSFQK